MGSDGAAKALVIERAKERDVAGILACLAAAFEEFRGRYTPEAFADTVLSPEAIRRRLKDMAIFVALDREGRVAGTIACRVAEPGRGHLRGMAVLPELRGAGLAQRLLERAEDHLHRQGCTQITLNTTEPLERAMRFYERSGFRRSGKEKDFFGMRLIEYAKAVETSGLAPADSRGSGPA
jgi:GNAT superfamily N-acetyltransferase